MIRPEPNQTPRIETLRLRLSPFSAEDVNFLHELFTEPSVRKYLWDDRVIERELVEQIVEASMAGFESTGLGFLLIRLQDGDLPVGFCGFRPIEEGSEIEILYGLLPAYQGSGFATEASRAALEYAFDHAGLDRVLAGADPPNASSFAVMRRLGMKFDHRREINGVEAVYHSISRQEFNAVGMSGETGGRPKREPAP